MPSSAVLFCRYDRLQERAAAFLREWSAQGEVLVVASSRYAADELVRRVCDTALIGIHRYTFRDLVYDLAGEPMNARGLVPMRRVAREALCASVAARRKLPWLGAVAGFPGFPRALSHTLEAIRLDCVAPDVLAATGRSGADLAALLRAYESECAERRLADYATRVRLAIEAVKERPPMAVLAVDPDLRTASERQLLDALCAHATAALQLSLGEEQTAPASTCLEAVQQTVLSGAPAPDRQDDGTVSLVPSSSEALEFVEIARRILRSGLPFDQTAVLLRNPQRHAPLLVEAFERAGIPVHPAEGVRRPDLSGRAFLTLLRCREERYSAARFAEYLALGEYPREEEEPLAAGRWERLLREAAVVHGRERWKTRLEKLLAAKLEKYQQKPEPFLAKDIDSLEKLVARAVPLIDRLATLPQSALWRDWIASLRSLGALALRKTTFLESMLEELAPVEDTGPVTLPEVARLLEQHLMTWNEPEGARYGKVFAAGLEQARGMSFRLVFIPGLNEGLFPRSVREDPLLLDSQRAVLSMEGSRDDGQLLRIAAACASERAVFSWSRVELATGRERVPSFFAIEVAKAAWGSSAEVRTDRNSTEARIGWSAPNDPADSIDDIEYDLSSFRLAAKSKQAGSFAWIRAANAHAFRAIRARQDRWSRDWTRADGLIAEDVHLSKMLEPWRLQKRHWSATALADFARCPYRFYLRRIAELGPLETPESMGRMDAALRGRLFHNAIADLFSTGADDIEPILRRLAEKAAEDNPPLVPGVWATEVDKLLADLRGWLSTRDKAWSPSKVEYEFEETLEGGWLVDGAVDLIEEHADGRLRVVDHKTGVPPKRKDEPQRIGRGEVLQPLLYAFAIEAALGRPVSGARLSYATMRGGYKYFDIPLDRGSREALTRVFAAIDKWIDRGFLPAAPREEGCRYCDCLPVCGPYEELRVSSKQRIQHPELHQIRGWR